MLFDLNTSGRIAEINKVITSAHKNKIKEVINNGMFNIIVQKRKKEQEGIQEIERHTQ